MSDGLDSPISVVIPVYNSDGSLDALVERLASVLRPHEQLGELILVNDGSHDKSWEAIEKLAHRHSWIFGINLMRNYGQHNALLCGIRVAKHPIVVTMDDDLQNPPEEIPALLSRLREGYDVVYGTPKHQTHGLLRDLASTITKWVLQGTMGAETARNVSAFRAIRTCVRNAFENYSGPHVSIDVLLTWGTKRFSSVTVQNNPRRIGVSNYTVAKLFVHAMNMMTGFSVVPLQIASIIGFAFTLFGFAVLIYVMGRYLLEGGAPAGFPFIASILAIFSGAQLFALGVIGEYLARIHFRTMDRPAYAIRTSTGLIRQQNQLTELDYGTDEAAGFAAPR